MRHRWFDSTGGHDTTTPVVYGHKRGPAPPGAALDPSPATVEPVEQPAETPDDDEANGATDNSEEYWAEDLVAAAAVAGMGPQIEARTGEHCRTCRVKDSCPVQVEGRRVVS